MSYRTAVVDRELCLGATCVFGSPRSSFSSALRFVLKQSAGRSGQRVLPGRHVNNRSTSSPNRMAQPSANSTAQLTTGCPNRLQLSDELGLSQLDFNFNFQTRLDG